MMKSLPVSDLMSQETKRNPSAFYAQFHEHEALSRVTDLNGMEAWMVTNYDDAVAILKDPRFTRDRRKVSPPEGRPVFAQEDASGNEELASSWRQDISTADAPEHTRLRHLVSKAFTPRMVEQLRPRIQQIADELLDMVQERGKMDLIADFALPLPMTVISEMLGIPFEERQQFRAWTQEIENTPEGEATRTSAVREFTHYLKTLVSRKRDQPGRDLTSELLLAEENGDGLNEHEIIAMLLGLIIAGHETTVNLIGNGMLALLEHPEQMLMLQRDPSLLPSAIEELLRYTPSVSMAGTRWATEDITVRGKVIRKGEMISVSLIAANIDPQQFANPDVLDITRQERKQLAFSKGIHSCLGAPLARLEGQIALGTLLQRLPHLRLECDPEHLIWNSHPSLRGLIRLPVTF